MQKRYSDTRARFAQRLRAIRIPRGYKTARSFAEALEIDENRYTRYERAEVEPDLQLLMRICSLLDATPNDLLCDTIGAPPVSFETPYGFSDRAGGTYQSGGHPKQPQASPAPAPSSLGDPRKEAAWELATLLANVEAEAAGHQPDRLTHLERLRRIGPIYARIEADVFLFLRELPDRLQGIDVAPETEATIERLTEEMIATNRAG
ncbi:MAG: helix-turn-helix domain-containing protein [Alphaproteobacteria bacterium]|nr:helix-turn-helix domain-containing protein [Alphaproteobacteria bacterium]